MLDQNALMWSCYDMPHVPLDCARTMPGLPGVYIVYQGENVLYIGQARNLAKRFKSHTRTKQFAAFGLGLEVAWMVFPENHILARFSYESALISLLKPSLNGMQSPGTNTFSPLVAQNLYNARIQAGIPQADVAAHLHITQQAYSRYETDTGIPMRYLSKVCEFLGLSANELVALCDTDATPVGVEGE